VFYIRCANCRIHRTRHFEYKCCTYAWLSNIKSLNALQYCNIQCNTASPCEPPLYLLPISGKHYSLYLVLIFVHRLGLQAHQISWPSNTYGRDKYRQPTGKNHCQEELLEQIKESADCIRENEIIRRAINSLLDQISCAFRKTEIILNNNQGRLLNTDIQWYCLIKTNVLLHSVIQQLSQK